MVCCSIPAAQKLLSDFVNCPHKASGCDSRQQQGLRNPFPRITRQVICILLCAAACWGGEWCAPHRDARKLGLAMRSPPNLFMGHVFEDALGKHASLSKRLLRCCLPAFLLSETFPSEGAVCCSLDLRNICKEMRAPAAASTRREGIKGDKSTSWQRRRCCIL